jgi:RNA polymerase sigma-70 factor (ECF subfamily)
VRRLRRQEGSAPFSQPSVPFDDQFTGLFRTLFPRLYRYLDRISGDPGLAEDLAQEAFIRLYRRGSLPDAPESWLISVAMNLFRNNRSTASRRRRLLTLGRGERVHSDPASAPDTEIEQRDERQGVRVALDRLPDRDRQMLLLHVEGFSYRDIASVLGLNEASVGTLLARARRAFQVSYEAGNAPG